MSQIFVPDEAIAVLSKLAEQLIIAERAGNHIPTAQGQLSISDDKRTLILVLRVSLVQVVADEDVPQMPNVAAA